MASTGEMVAAGASAAEKRRILILTDIENEPDDAQSLVRFLTYANQFDVEGLVATTSTHQKDRTAAQRIRRNHFAVDTSRDITPAIDKIVREANR